MNFSFITAEEILLAHNWMLEKTHGLAGISDEGRIEALCGRVINLHYYEGVNDPYVLAGMYLIAIAKGHVFNDANKRTALFTCLAFLDRNNFPVENVPELTELTVRVAASEADLEEVADTLKRLAK